MWPPSCACVPHKCQCGSHVDTQGLHERKKNLKKAPRPRRTTRRESHIIIWRAFNSAGNPAVRKPSGLGREDEEEEYLFRQKQAITIQT